MLESSIKVQSNNDTYRKNTLIVYINLTTINKIVQVSKQDIKLVRINKYIRYYLAVRSILVLSFNIVGKKCSDFLQAKNGFSGPILVRQ